MDAFQARLLLNPYQNHSYVFLLGIQGNEFHASWKLVLMQGTPMARFCKRRAMRGGGGSTSGSHLHRALINAETPLQLARHLWQTADGASSKRSPEYLRPVAGKKDIASGRKFASVTLVGVVCWFCCLSGTKSAERS